MTLQTRTGTWAELQSDAKPIREQVFIQEQQIAAVDEWDAQDEISQHFVVCDGEQVIATARLLPNHSIGRVAVLASHRTRDWQAFDARDYPASADPTTSFTATFFSSACNVFLPSFRLSSLWRSVYGLWHSTY